MSITSLNSGIFKLVTPIKLPQEPETTPTETDSVEETPTSGTDELKSDYEQEYNKAVETLNEWLKNSPSPISSPDEASSFTVRFSSGGKTYWLTAKPTYYKGTDGQYYLHDTTRNGMQSQKGSEGHIEYILEEVPSELYFEGRGEKKGNINIEYPGDEPNNWMSFYGSGKGVVQEDGSILIDDRILYDKKQLESHLPQDIIDQFFVQDADYPDGYKLADNVKSIKLVSDDPTQGPRYKITYIDDDGREKGMTFGVAEMCTADASGKVAQTSLEAIGVNVVDTAEIADVMAKAKELIARRASQAIYKKD